MIIFGGKGDITMFAGKICNNGHLTAVRYANARPEWSVICGVVI
jgi:hypothetical protein